MRIQRELLMGLISISNTKPRDMKFPRHGICSALHDANHHYYDTTGRERHSAFSALYQQWPNYSGEPDYPIDGLFLYTDYSIPKWTGQYGKLRLELLDFCIDKLLKEIFKDD